MVDPKSFFYKQLSDFFKESEIDHIWNEAKHFKYTLVDQEVLADCVDRLLENEPYQYIFGRAYFYNFELSVTKDVLIPRPETEELLHLISKEWEGLSPKVIDIGTGSGCLALGIGMLVKDAKVTALDVSPKALEIAHKNAIEHGVGLQFIEKNILEEGLTESYDVIVSNPPYIPQEERKLMEVNVLQYEPELALFVEDEDPLIFYERIADLGVNHLKENGAIYFECNEYNATEVHEMMGKKGYSNCEIIQDMQGKDRMIRARK